MRVFMPWRSPPAWGGATRGSSPRFPRTSTLRARRRQYGIRHLTPADVAADSGAVREWLHSCGASRVAVHFDMDVLDPAEIVAAVGVVPGGMKTAEVVRVIGDIAATKELVALTVAEPMPRTAVRIRNMLRELPLLR